MNCSYSIKREKAKENNCYLDSQTRTALSQRITQATHNKLTLVKTR